jgi:hypothetical protein
MFSIMHACKYATFPLPRTNSDLWALVLIVKTGDSLWLHQVLSRCMSPYKLELIVLVQSRKNMNIRHVNEFWEEIGFPNSGSLQRERGDRCGKHSTCEVCPSMLLVAGVKGYVRLGIQHVSSNTIPVWLSQTIPGGGIYLCRLTISLKR